VLFGAPPDFFAETFAGSIHLTPKRRFLIALVHDACMYGESPEGKVTALTSDLAKEQSDLLCRIARDTVKG
jgi:hypothetical protein